MAVHTYECLFLLDPNKSSSDIDGMVRLVNGLIERHGGEIIASRPWGEPKLAYPIKKFRKGTYVLTYFKAAPTAVPEMEKDFRLAIDTILRHMILKLHPQIAEAILSHLDGEGNPLQQLEPAGDDRP